MGRKELRKPWTWIACSKNKVLLVGGPPHIHRKPSTSWQQNDKSATDVYMPKDLMGKVRFQGLDFPATLLRSCSFEAVHGNLESCNFMHFQSIV